MTKALYFSTACLLVAGLAFAKSPAETSTVCDRYQQSDVIFTGTAETAWVTMLDTHRLPVRWQPMEKSKRIRFLVREWYKGRRSDTVEVWMTPGDCNLSIEADKTYLIYARINKDKRRVESDRCAGTIPVAQAAADLVFLTAAQLGPAQATHLSGNAGAPGLNIQAQSGVDSRYAITDAAGKFAFDGLPAGDWNLFPVGGAPTPVHLEPNSCQDVVLK